MATELIWSGPVDMSGYGTACIGYAVGLTRAEIRLQLIDKSQSQNLSGKGMDDNIKATVQRLQAVEVSKTAARVQHQVADKISPIKLAKKNIGYTIFEMTRVPKLWVTHCNLMDQIWTGSEYSKAAFVNTGVEESKVHVVPHIIDTDRFSPSVAPLTLPKKAQWNFVSVFDFQARKAWREMLTAYIKAFKPNDDVCLWLKCFRNGFNKEDKIGLLAQIYKFVEEMGFTKVPRIEICPSDIPHALIPSFYRSFDCYVSISREGFGLTYAEAAACGLTIIGPERSGTREFLNGDNSYLVDYTGDTLISEEMLKHNSSFAGLEWANHSIDSLIAQMRYVYENPDKARAKGVKARESVQSLLHYSVVGDKVKHLLSL